MMETENSEANNLFNYDIVKVELEEEEYENADYANISTEPPELVFSNTEVTVDPRTGLSICMLCLADLLPEEVTEHMVNIHKFRKIFPKCWDCGMIFQEKEHLTIHKQCCIPKKTVKKKVTMKQLMKKATENADANVCPICLVELKETMQIHLDKEHQMQKNVKTEFVAVDCPICNKTYKSKAHLNQHIKLVHQAVRNSVECSECCKKFATQKLLTNHMRNVHPTDGKIHTCDECGKGFKSHQSLYQHLKHVHGIKAKSGNTSTDDN